MANAVLNVVPFHDSILFHDFILFSGPYLRVFQGSFEYAYTQGAIFFLFLLSLCSNGPFPGRPLKGTSERALLRAYVYTRGAL